MAENGAQSESSGPTSQADIDAMLAQAGADDVAVDDAAEGTDQMLADAQAAVDELVAETDAVVGGDSLETISADMQATTATTLEMLGDVELRVTVELGRTQMLVEDVLRLANGSVVELDKLAGDPVDVFVNQRLVARGEVLVLNDNFCIRINEIVDDLEEQAQEAAASVMTD